MKSHELTRREAISLVGAGGLGFSTARLLGFASHRPTRAQSDKVQAPTQAPTALKDATSLTALMPQPRSVGYGDGWLPVKGGFPVTWVAYRNPVLDRAVLRFQNDVARRTGLDVGASAAQIRIDCRSEDKGI